MESFIQVKEATVITPAEPTPTRVLALSTLDSQLFLRFTIEYLLIYHPCPGSERATTTARFKSALSQALVPYYPLAGRVRALSGGSTLEVVCRAQGAVFIEASSDQSISDFENAPRYVTEWRDFLSIHVDDVLGGAPPLVVQLTWLADGGAAVGVGINHCLCDGIGSANFLNFFAELATRRRRLAELKPKPVWARHLLNPIAMPLTQRRGNLLNHPEFSQVTDLAGFATRFSQELLTPTSVLFDKKNLNELKQHAGSKSWLGNQSYTSFEVLTAHVWRSWTAALELPRNQILKLLFSVNVRNRLKPGLPNGYYGNGFVLACAQTSSKELVEKGLGYGAELVKRAKERVGEEYVRRVVELVSESRAIPDSAGVLILSQWSRLGLDRVDFGMGGPVYVGPVCCDRYCLFLPVYEQSEAVKVMLAVPTTAVDKYEYLLRRPFS